MNKERRDELQSFRDCYGVAELLDALEAAASAQHSLKSDLDRIRSERNDLRSKLANWECTVDSFRADIAKLEGERDALRRLVSEALNELETWIETETQYPSFGEDPGWQRVAAIRKEAGL